MAKQPIRVLVVDDQPLQREAFQLVLDSQRDITVIGDVGDGAQALAFVRRNPTDVVLMDVRMPRVNGFTATERILTDDTVRELGPVPRVVLVTALDLDDFVATSVAVGADALLYKDADPEALLQAVRAAAKHHAAQ